MPLLVIAAAHGRGAWLLAASAALLFASPWELPRFALDFSLGVVAYRERAAIAAFFERLGATLRGAVVIAGLLLWVSPLFFATVQVFRNQGFTRSFLIAGFAPLEVAAMGAGAAVLVASAVHVPALRRALAAGPLLFLGRISYSLYLLHWAVLTFFAPRLVDGSMRGNLALLLVVVPVAIALSVPAYRWVERPSIALGNRLCRRIARRLGAAPVESHAAQT
jgi:peptidoglycan/LPS O-acetylase OafA/YrhL